MAKIQRALLSVSDKTGLVPFAQTLAEAGVELISTGGTARILRERGLKVKDLSAHTGFPEMLDGRVKTLHPKIHGGLLYIRGNAEHESRRGSTGIGPIDIVVVNLYPFEQTVAKPDVTLHDAIENIDIGGPSMLRSAAKNHESVTVVDRSGRLRGGRRTDQSSSGNTTLEMRRTTRRRVFARTAAYDAAIAAPPDKVFGIRALTSAQQRHRRCASANRTARPIENSRPNSRNRCATGKTRISGRRSMALSRVLSSNSTARNFPTTTSWISRRRRR